MRPPGHSSERPYRQSHPEIEIRVVEPGSDFETFAASVELTELMQECVDARCHIILDMSGVRCMDTTGLALLSRTSSELHEAGWSLVLLAPPRQVRDVLELADTDGNIALASIWAEAKQRLGAVDSAAPAVLDASSPDRARRVDVDDTR